MCFCCAPDCCWPSFYSSPGLRRWSINRGCRRALQSFGIPERLVAVAAVFLPITELTIAISLIPTRTAQLGGLVSLVLLSVFAVAIAINLAKGRQPDCRCFGKLSSNSISSGTLVRNLRLMGAATFVVWRAPYSRLSVTAGSVAYRPLDAVELALPGCLAALVALVGSLALNLLRQQGRLLLRIEALEQAGGLGANALDSPKAAQPSGLDIGVDAPDFRLQNLDGQHVSLQALRSRGTPVVLIFTDAACGPCVSLAARGCELARSI